MENKIKQTTNKQTSKQASKQASKQTSKIDISLSLPLLSLHNFRLKAMHLTRRLDTTNFAQYLHQSFYFAKFGAVVLKLR